MFTSAKIFVGRLSRGERANILSAQTMDRLDYLFYAHHKYEFALPVEKARKVFLEAVDIVRAEFTVASATKVF